MSQPWLSRLDAALAEKDLALPGELRTALRLNINNTPTHDPQTLKTVRILAISAMTIVQQELDVSRSWYRDTYLQPLREEVETWRNEERTTRANTILSENFNRVANIENGSRLGLMMRASARLLRYGFPFDYANPDNPNASPKRTDIIEAVTQYLVVIKHCEWVIRDRSLRELLEALSKE